MMSGTAIAVMILTAAACSSKGEAEVKGWPRAAPLVRSGVTAGDAGSGSLRGRSQPAIPPRPELTDIAAALEAKLDASRDVLDVGPDDASDGADAVRVKTWPGMTTCDRLIETACAYLGEHSQECAEIRGWRRPKPSEESFNECQAILDQFDMNYNQRGLRRVRSPCWSLAYDVCRDFGRKSDECLDARAAARRLRTPMLRSACKGGVIVYEAKRAFPDWGPNSAPRSVRE